MTRKNTQNKLPGHFYPLMGSDLHFAVDWNPIGIGFDWIAGDFKEEFGAHQRKIMGLLEFSGA